MQRFNIYNFCSDFQMKAALTGVYHDSGYKVASDAVVMVAIKAEYPEELEHHIITNDGVDIPAKYPHWKSCIPDGQDYKPYKVDFKKYDEFIKRRREAWKALEGHGIKWNEEWTIKVGPAYLKAKNFDRFAAGMKELGTTEIYVMDRRHTVYAKTDNGWVLIFPILTERRDDDPYTLILA